MKFHVSVKIITAISYQPQPESERYYQQEFLIFVIFFKDF